MSDMSEMPDETPSPPKMSKTQASIPSIMNIKSLPVNQAQMVDTDVLEPLVFSQEFARWELLPKGFLHPGSKISIGFTNNATLSRVFPFVNVGIHSLVRRAVLKTSAGRVICETEDWNVLEQCKSMFVSNSANKEREQYTTGRQVNYEVLYDALSRHKASHYGLSNNNEYATNDWNKNEELKGLSVQDHLIMSEGSTFQIALHDLFPFLKAGNQLPLFLLGQNERIQIELFWEPDLLGNRLSQSASGVSTGTLVEPMLIDQTKCKVIADYVFYDQATMDRYAETNDNMTFSYIDYRQSVQSLTRDGATDQPRNNVRNIGGQGRLINKVFFAYEDPNRRTTITDTLTGRYTAVGSSASGTSVKPMVSNLFVNSEFLYPQSINNCARQFHNLQEVGGMVPFVSRECYSGEGSGGLAPTGKDADVEGYVQDTLAGQFFWQGFKTSGLASRVDSRGIDLHTDIQLDDLNGKTKTAYVQRCWLEVVRYLTIVDGHLEVFYA